MQPFYEEQKFRQAWLWTLLIGAALVSLWGSYQQLVVGDPIGNHPVADGLLAVLALIPVALLVLFWIMKLSTTLSEQGVAMQYFPFLHKRWTWQEIEKAEVREYRPLAEYGGWGFRRVSKGWAYSVAGKHGLELTLKNGKVVMIGTQRPEAMQQWLNALPGE